MLLSGYQTVIQLTALAGFWSAYASHSAFSDYAALQWRIPVAMQLLPGFFLLLETFFIPESPSALAECGHLAKAEESLRWLRDTTMADPIFDEEIKDLLDAFVVGHQEAESCKQ